jgi:hypothetical protein
VEKVEQGGTSGVVLLARDLIAKAVGVGVKPDDSFRNAFVDALCPLAIPETAHENVVRVIL